MTLSPTSTAEELVAHLKRLRNEENIAGMARFGIAVRDHALGISNADLRIIARQVKKNHDRALALWQSGVREAKLLACYTEEPKKVTAEQVRTYAHSFNSWEMVDGWATLFIEAGHIDLIEEFIADEREFVRRTGFAMIVWATVHLKKLPDERVLAWLPLIEAHATDPRNFVKKAVNWALRQIGKRSLACHGPALALAERLAGSPGKTARWIGKDAVRELKSEAVMKRVGKGSAGRG